MRIILSILAPIVYLLIVAFSLGIALIQAGNRRIDPGPIAGFLAGWVAFAFAVVVVRFGVLDLPDIPTNLWTIFISGFIGFFVGILYLAIAKFVNSSKALVSLFILGSVGGSLISLYFYIVFEQVQVVFISSAITFLFGVLIYIILFESQGHPRGIRGAYGDFVTQAKRRR